MAMRRNFPARRFGYTPRRRTTRKVARPWNSQEIAFMRKFYRNYETAWIARQLGRTVYSVRYKAVDLNLQKASPSVWKGNVGTPTSFRRSFSKTWGPGIKTRKTHSRRRPRTQSMRAGSHIRTPRPSRRRRTPRITW
jgi:hypothetical protein